MGRFKVGDIVSIKGEVCEYKHTKGMASVYGVELNNGQNVILNEVNVEFVSRPQKLLTFEEWEDGKIYTSKETSNINYKRKEGLPLNLINSKFSSNAISLFAKRQWVEVEE